MTLKEGYAVPLAAGDEEGVGGIRKSGVLLQYPPWHTKPFAHTQQGSLHLFPIPISLEQRSWMHTDPGEHCELE